MDSSSATVIRASSANPNACEADAGSEGRRYAPKSADVTTTAGDAAFAVELRSVVRMFVSTSDRLSR